MFHLHHLTNRWQWNWDCLRISPLIVISSIVFVAILCNNARVCQRVYWEVVYIQGGHERTCIAQLWNEVRTHHQAFNKPFRKYTNDPLEKYAPRKKLGLQRKEWFVDPSVHIRHTLCQFECGMGQISVDPLQVGLYRPPCNRSILSDELHRPRHHDAAIIQ